MLAVTRFEDQTSLTMPTIKAIPRGGVWSSLVASQGRFSSLRCGDSTLTRSSATTEGGLDRGMDIRALWDALVCIRSDEQHRDPERARSRGKIR